MSSASWAGRAPGARSRRPGYGRRPCCSSSRPCRSCHLCLPSTARRGGPPTHVRTATPTPRASPPLFASPGLDLEERLDLGLACSPASARCPGRALTSEHQSKAHRGSSICPRTGLAREDVEPRVDRSRDEPLDQRTMFRTARRSSIMQQYDTRVQSSSAALNIRLARCGGRLQIPGIRCHFEYVDRSRCALFESSIRCRKRCRFRL